MMNSAAVTTRDRAEADVSDAGVRLTDNPDVAVDVLVAEQRIWSFNPRRDTVRHDGAWCAEWPPPLQPFMHGRGRVVLREHVSGRVLLDRDVHLGDSDAPLQVIDAQGHPLSISKTGHLGRSFVERDEESVGLLLDATDEALQLLNDHSAVSAFLAFGALLGAVRDGHLIGHDVDLDLGYVSRHQYPVDVARESFELERMFRRRGWETWRFSAADFKILVPGISTAAKWIDIFGGFVADEVFYLMPNVAVPADHVKLLPLGEVMLEGRPVVAPADPATLLEATYGPGWVTPDPSFKYRTPKATVRRMDAWMRNAIANRGHWLPFYEGPRSRTVPTEPSAFARAFAESKAAGSRVLDLGCGTGRDAIWLANNGFRAVGLDYAPPAVRLAREAAHAAGSPATFEVFNLYDLRQVLAAGARYAHDGQLTDLYGRFLLHALTPRGRNNLWRFAALCLRRGGRLHLEFRTGTAPDDYQFGAHFRDLVGPELVTREIEASGGRVEQRTEGHGMAVYKDEDPYVCRMVASWQR